MNVLIRALASVAHSPYVNVVAGIILIVTAILDLADTGIERLLGTDVHVAHGLIAAGIAQVLQALPPLVTGAERLSKGELTLKRGHQSEERVPNEEASPLPKRGAP